MNHGNLIQFHLVKLPRTINRKISRKRNSEQSEKSAKYKFTVDQLKSLQSNKINARKIAAQTEIWQIFWAIQTEVQFSFNLNVEFTCTKIRKSTAIQMKTAIFLSFCFRSPPIFISEYHEFISFTIIIIRNPLKTTADS